MILKYIFQPGASLASSLLSKAYLSKQIGYEPEQINLERNDFQSHSFQAGWI